MNVAYPLTSKFQVTVPKQVRKDMDLDEADKIVYRKDKNGRYYLERAPRAMTIQELRARNQRLMRERGIGPVSIDDMRHARQKFYEQGGTW